MILQIICAILAWSLIGLSVLRIRQTLTEGLSHIQRIHQVPCHQCLYFTGDYRLKCPVNPLNALTEEAINCEDFEVKPKWVQLAPIVSVSSSKSCQSYGQRQTR